MKIVTFDHNKLILLSLKKKLSEIGYQVKIARTSKEAIQLIKETNPDLVTLDISSSDYSGLDILKYLKESHSNAKIVMISEENDSIDIVDLFEYGIDDFIKKPATLSEIVLRINRIIGTCPIPDEVLFDGETSMVREKSIGVVIPCYNEESRLSESEFRRFVRTNIGYHLCFVNDGSSDNTLRELEEISRGREDYISVLNCEKNGGKAEAVRLGMLHLAKNKDLNFDYIGFLDADLSTDLYDFDDLLKTINTTNYKIVSGSRIERMGANITKQSARKLISLTINFIIQQILGMKFKDTQCGAKIIDKDLIPLLFGKKFITRWLFDVEIFLRMKNKYGDVAKELICEQPLRRWIHVDGSKLSMRDSLSIGFQLTRIATHYR
ncbi:response regulator [uncultured Tenacibaculum sp.]|uniref:response regulator n=1 Tax=uncultured Tenacibaculum sp. TaxID=174713 RepID=UPI00262A1802|nr:response regulator [uncultured Tenacibaculum sp.]